MKHKLNVFVNQLKAGIKRVIIAFIAVTLMLLSGIAPVTYSQSSNMIKFNHVFETGGYNFDIAQDKDGFIWVGTINGVRVFDGYEVKSYTASEKTFPTNNIRSVFVDSEGLVWLATFGGLAMYDKNKDAFTVYLNDPEDPGSISSSVFNGSPNLIAESDDGRLWFGTASGLNSFDKRTRNFTHYFNDPKNRNSLSGNNILSVFYDKDGFIWVGTKEKGLNKFNLKTKTFTRYIHDPATWDKTSGIGPGEVNAVSEDADGDLWIGTSKSGLTKFDKETGKFTNYQHDPNDADSLADNDIRAIIPSMDGSLWICHPYWVTVGIERFDKKSGTFTRHKHDPANPDTSLSDRVQIAFEDDSGILWIGENLSTVSTYDKHFYKFNLYKPVSAHENSILSNIIAIVEDHDKNIWLGSGTEGLVKYDRENDNFIKYPGDTDSSDHKNLTSMYVDSSGNVWITTNDGKLGILDTKKGKFSKRYYNPKLIESWSMLEDPQDPETLWFGTENNGVIKFNKNTETFTGYEPRGRNSYLLHILGVHSDDEGDLWFTNESNGLIKYDRETDGFSAYRHNADVPDSINSDNINFFTVSSEGGIWVGSQKGLNKLDKDNETFLRFEKDAGFRWAVRGILEDDNGFLWISSDSGLLKFDTGINKVVRRYEEGGLKYNFSPMSVLKTTDGEMWFSSSMGVIRFDPGNVRENPVAPRVYLTSITQGGEKIIKDMAAEKVRKIELDWRHNYFEFKYVALNYTRSEKNHYAYMLEGFDKEWYSAGHQRYGRYSGLPGGRYTLRIKGSNNDDVWNHEGASLEVNVASPWWESKLFLGSLAGFAVFLISFLYMLRVRSIELRNLKLREIVKKKTRKLREANLFLKAAHEDLEIKNEELNRLSMTDTLTGLLNRRAIKPIIEKEMSRKNRFAHPVSFMILDLDNFKQVNDQYGHAAGDEVLSKVAGTIKSILRKTDSIARWGGEEFVVLAVDVDLIHAVAMAEKIRKTVMSICFERVRPVTVSIGIAEYHPDEDFQQWYNRADSALYKAKNEGRNRAVANRYAPEKGDEMISVGSILETTWSKTLYFGHPVIDKQHNELFEQSRQIIDAILTDMDKDSIKTKLEKLLNIFKEHFDREEQMLAQTDYPELESHKEEHCRLIIKLSQLIDNIREGSADSIMFVKFITQDYISEHLAMKDKDVFRF
ncbi:MAG: diguanylate cyclase [Desulfobacteraceae bacterium]|nr:diguanylate cyclase [Desulfobacteraceae bacterium]